MIPGSEGGHFEAFQGVIPGGHSEAFQGVIPGALGEHSDAF